MPVPRQTVITVEDGAIVARKLAPGAVLASKIADAAVETEHLATNAVTTPKIQDHAVTADKLAPDAVTTDAIVDGAVTADKLAPGAVPGGQLVKDADLTAQVNGITPVFTLPENAIAGTICCYRNGAREIRGVTFNETALNQITLLVVPLVGETIEVSYQI
jgi:hypothetical protein